MIAIARHAIDVDYNNVPPQARVGIGAIIIPRAVGYFYFKKASVLSLQKEPVQQSEADVVKLV